MMKRKLRIFLWRWHRRIGLLAAFFILLLSISGILLNHSHSIGLDQKHANTALIQFFYNIKMPNITSFALKNGWLSHVEGGHLYYVTNKTNKIGECNGSLKGVIENDHVWLVACSDELLLLTPDGELIEKIGRLQGLPQAIEYLGRCAQGICLQAKGMIYHVDIDQLTWHVDAKVTGTWSKAEPLPKALKSKLISLYVGPGINWERLLLDLHSGRLWGAWGVYLMDAMAILFIVLGLSGVCAFYMKRK